MGGDRARLGRRAPREGPEWRRLTRLMGARLALSVAILLAALSLVGVREGAEAADRGLYGTVAGAFLAVALYAGLFRFVRNAGRFGAAQVATDVSLLTSLVYFTGAKDSLFTFLYVPIIVYAAQLFGRRGAYGSATLASLAYGSLLASVDNAWLGTPVGLAPGTGVPWTTLWLLHSGAWLLVALLSSALWRELHRTGRELDQRRSDLARLRRLHERTVESLTSGLLTLDRAGRVTSFNPEAERITGVPSAEALGRPVEALLPGVPVRQPSPERRGRRRMPYRRRDGEERFLGVAVSVLRDEVGQPGGHVVIFQDVTQVVEMENDLRRSERLAAVGELAAGMAHEVRNPLAAISGSIQMLRELPAGEERQRLMQIVLRETDRLDALIGEFLRFARPAPPKLERIELARSLAELLEVFEASRPPGLELVTEVPGDLVVRADADQLRQLLWNLVRNAVQAMGKRGCLALRARRTTLAQGPDAGDRSTAKGTGEVWVEIAVTDTGPGIPPELLDRIFEPFFTTRPDGSGLGLATVHRVVEAHGGLLRLETRPGEGTTFRILLPEHGATE